MKLLKNSPGGELTPSRVQYGALLLTAFMEALLIIHRATVRVETYMVIPPFLFLGAALCTEKSREARRDLRIGLVCVLWFCVAQEIHRSTEGDIRALGLFAPAYLLAFPFASVSRGRERQKALRVFSYVYLAATLIVCVCALALVFKVLPDSLSGQYYWDGTRLYASGYPTIMACPLMIAIAFCLGQVYRLEDRRLKALYLLLMGIVLAVQALTNDRTAILLTDALIGGSVFFAQTGKGRKRVLAGLAAALVLFVGLYIGATALFNANTAALQKNFYAQQATAETEPEETAQETLPEEAAAPAEEAAFAAEAASAEYYVPLGAIDSQEEVVTEETLAEEAAAPAEEAAPAETAPDSGERSLLAHLSTLNGRTEIWAGAIDALKDNPSILLYGVHDVAAAVTEWDPLIEHTHNSYLEILFWLGLPGLAMALYFTFLALRSGLKVLFGKVPMYRKCAAMLCLCLLANGMLEPLLFTGANYYHYLNFYFFLCLSYVNQWAAELPGRKAARRKRQ